MRRSLLPEHAAVHHHNLKEMEHQDELQVLHPNTLNRKAVAFRDQGAYGSHVLLASIICYHALSAWLHLGRWSARFLVSQHWMPTVVQWGHGRFTSSSRHGEDALMY